MGRFALSTGIRGCSGLRVTAAILFALPSSKSFMKYKNHAFLYSSRLPGRQRGKQEFIVDFLKRRSKHEHQLIPIRVYVDWLRECSRRRRRRGLSLARSHLKMLFQAILRRHGQFALAEDATAEKSMTLLESAESKARPATATSNSSSEAPIFPSPLECRPQGVSP